MYGCIPIGSRSATPSTGQRCLYFSAKADNVLWDAEFQANSCLVFGSETHGMPDRIIENIPSVVSASQCQAQSATSTSPTAVGIVLYEAIRQRTPPRNGKMSK